MPIMQPETSQQLAMESSGSLSCTKPTARRTFLELLRFGFVGILNTAFGYGIYVGFLWIGVWPWLALLFATVLGILFNFKTTGYLVFQHRANRGFYLFLLVYGGIYALNTMLLYGLMLLGWSPQIAQAILLGPIALTTFFSLRTFVFSEEQ